MQQPSLHCSLPKEKQSVNYFPQNMKMQHLILLYPQQRPVKTNVMHIFQTIILVKVKLHKFPRFVLWNCLSYFPNVVKDSWLCKCLIPKTHLWPFDNCFIIPFEQGTQSSMHSHTFTKYFALNTMFYREKQLVIPSINSNFTAVQFSAPEHSAYS